MHDLIPISNEIPEEVLSNQEKKDLQSINNIKLPTVIENKSNLPMSKEDIVKMHTDSIKATEAGKLMRKLAKHYKTSGANPQIYIQALIKAIECGEFVLRTELALAEELRKIEKHQGVRKDLEKHQNVRTKADIIQDFGLTKQQAKDISMLEDWAVNMAIKESWEKHKVPTREMALKMIKEKHKKENNKPYNPEAIYMDYVPYPDEIMKLPPIRSTTLFSNVGIDEFFLEYAHVKNCIMAELEKDRVEFYKTNYPNVKCFQGDLFDKDIQKGIIEEHIKQGCKLLIATPPCQTFTVSGKRDFKDIRTQLFIPTLDIIEGINSVNDYVLIENVKEYMKASPKHLRKIIGEKTIVEYIKYRLEQLGYEVNIDKINAANYGTPQSRKRVIILASKKGMWKFPLPFKKQVTLMEAIGHLPSLDNLSTDNFFPSGYKNASQQDKLLYLYRYWSTPQLTKQEIEMLRHTPTGKSAWDNSEKYQPKTKEGNPSKADRKSRFKRNSWNEPTHTLTSDSGSISGMNTIHPGHPIVDRKGNILWSDARVYTLYEKLILLGFHNGEAWCHNKPEFQIPAWASENLINTVLGESFLPRLAAVLAETIPNRTAHPDEKLEDYPQMVDIEGDSFKHYPVVSYELRNYDLNDNIYKKNMSFPIINKK